MKLADRHVVVTGASQGIGAEMAREFAKRGANVSLVARSADLLDSLAAELGGVPFPGDLLDNEFTDHLIDQIEESVGPIDVLVNNAGLETNSLFHKTDPEQIRAVSKLNLEVPMVLTRSVLPGMLERKRGHFLFTSSLAGTGGFPGLAAYSASKAGLTNFAATIRMELKSTSLGVSVIAPGPVDTRMWGTIEDVDDLSPMLKRLRLLQLIPMFSPEEIASLAVSAVTKDKAYVGLPKRLGINHVLRNLPTKITSTALTGVPLGPQE